jgi:hypothetical protein
MASVACDNVGCPTYHRTFHNFVIIGVSRNSFEGVGNGHELQEGQQIGNGVRDLVRRKRNLVTSFSAYSSRSSLQVTPAM